MPEKKLLRPRQQSHFEFLVPDERIKKYRALCGECDSFFDIPEQVEGITKLELKCPYCLLVNQYRRCQEKRPQEANSKRTKPLVSTPDESTPIIFIRPPKPIHGTPIFHNTFLTKLKRYCEQIWEDCTQFLVKRGCAKLSEENNSITLEKRLKEQFLFNISFKTATFAKKGKKIDLFIILNVEDHSDHHYCAEYERISYAGQEFNIAKTPSNPNSYNESSIVTNIGIYFRIEGFQFFPLRVRGLEYEQMAKVAFEEIERVFASVNL